MKRIIGIISTLIIFGLIACGGGGSSKGTDPGTDNDTGTEDETLVWTTSSNTFSKARGDHSSAVYNDYLYILGGYNETNKDFNDIQYAKINSDGSLDSFTTSSNTFSNKRNSHSSLAYNGYLYVIGGWYYYNYSSTPSYNDVQYAAIEDDGSIGSFTTSSNTFSSARSNLSAVVYNNYLYIIGGMDLNSNAFFGDIQYAAINSSDGSLGSFTTSSNTFSKERAYHSSVVYNGYLYILGGCDSSNIDFSDIQYAAINSSDGSLGSFTTNSISLPAGLSTFGCFVYNGYIFIIGGASGTDGSTFEVCNTVYYAKINDDGSIGDFSETTSFTNARYAHSGVLNGNYAYVIGGFDLYNYYNDIQIGDLSEIW